MKVGSEVLVRATITAVDKDGSIYVTIAAAIGMQSTECWVRPNDVVLLTTATVEQLDMLEVSYVPGPGARMFRDGFPAEVVATKETFPTVAGEGQTIHGTPYGEHLEIGADGMQKDYVVLTPEERAKGFVEPVRQSYVHEKCGGKTTMGVALAETYAREPSFYSGTYCARCGDHFPVGETGEFTWSGTTQKVGTRSTP